jgi:protein-L-isoaspartate(D-aspartate) O-methyltransferase
MPSPSVDADFANLRLEMVSRQLRARGIKDERVLRAMQQIPREAFVPLERKAEAYNDGPLPIGCGQTISQPFIVALMTELLQLNPLDRVLEIGTGSGYQTAVLVAITPYVYTVERIPQLAQRAKTTLRSTGCTAVKIHTGDGSLGWQEEAPFDAIIVTSAAPEIPETLKEQLALGGRLVIPVGDRHLQTLYCIERKPDTFTVSRHSNCMFVPLVGKHGWQE